MRRATATDAGPVPKSISLYEWQADALIRSQSKAAKRWTFWACGTGAGKSYGGGPWLLCQQIAAAQRLAADKTQRRKRPLTLMGAPSLDSLRRNMIAPLLEITNGTIYEGRYNENRHEFYWPAAAGGGMTVCGSFDNKESIKRMEGGQYDAAWVDEATMTPGSAHALLMARTAVRQGRILLTGYWYPPINWVYRKIWKLWEAGAEDIEVLNLPSTANPHYPREEMETARRTLDPALFAMRYLGRPEQMVGLVFGEAWNSTDPLMHCEPFDIPADKDEHGRYKWRVFTGGLDAGYSPAPFRVVMGAEDPATGIEFQFCEYSSLATTTHEKAVGVVKMLVKYVPGATTRHYDIWGDPSNKQGLADLQYELDRLNVVKDGVPRLDIKIRPAANAVESGIETLTAELKLRKFRVMRGRCPHLVEEFGLYCRDSNGEIVKGDDHSLDAARYKRHSLKVQRDTRRRYETPATGESRGYRAERSERYDVSDHEADNPARV